MEVINENVTKGSNLVPVGDSEGQVGITEFMSTKGAPIPLLSKYKFTDFIVMEITEDGTVTRATKEAYSAPKKDAAEGPKKGGDKEESKEINEKPANAALLTEEQVKEIITKFSEAFPTVPKTDVTKLKRFLELFTLDVIPDKRESIEILGPEDKLQRGELHHFVKQHLPFLGTETKKTASGDNNIQFSILRKGNTRQQNAPKAPAKYVEFTLTKINMDVMEAITLISRGVYKKPKHFGFAGNKDKRGVTCQRVTLQNTTIEQLEKIQRHQYKILQASMNSFMSASLWNKNLELTQMTYVDRPLRLGMLQGNRFSIALRGVHLIIEPHLNKLDQNCKNLSENGFINYYGLQRFGSTQVRTHEVGKLLLKKDWKEAYCAILRAECREERVNIAKKKFLEDFNFTEALKVKIDRVLIEGLQKAGKGAFLNAIQNLPKGIRILYVHALQSYIWNKVVSRRLKEHGHDLVVGDLVLKKSKTTAMEEEKKVNAGGQEGGEDEIAEEDLAISDEGEDEIPQDNVELVDDLAKFSDYTIHDAVVPVVGAETTLDDKGLIGKICKEVLEEEGVNLGDFKEISRFFQADGAIRKMIVRPQNFTWKTIRFSNRDQEVLSPYNDADDFPGDENGNFVALIIKFSLPKSSYATMLFREITAAPTNFDYQIQLNAMYTEGPAKDAVGSSNNNNNNNPTSEQNQLMTEEQPPIIENN